MAYNNVWNPTVWKLRLSRQRELIVITKHAGDSDQFYAHFGGELQVMWLGLEDETANIMARLA